MSVEALAWVLNHAPVDNPTAKLVLIALANHASSDGTAAFPSVSTIGRYTCLSERTIRTHLDGLERAGIIRRCDPRIVAAYIRRADRRPVGYDIVMNEVQDVQVVDVRGASDNSDGVHLTTARGAGDAPEPYIEPYKEPSISFMSDADASNAETDDMTEARRLCNLLAESLVRNGYGRSTITKAWLQAMERMIRIDGREPYMIERAIEWVEGNDFWSMNIRSPQKLREHYERLRAEASREAQRREPRGFAAIRSVLTEEGML